MTELSSDGKSLVYSSYLGGLSYDVGNGLALGAGGQVYVVGTHYTTYDTASSFFPTTANAYQTTPGSAPGTGADAFLSVFDPKQSGTASLVYSTLLGGPGNEEGDAVAADAHGNAYLTGLTSSAPPRRRRRDRASRSARRSRRASEAGATMPS